MSFFESVVQKTKKLERLLEDKFQASGKGLHEKATSVEHKLDSDLVKQIRFIASVRNKLMHEDGYIFDGEETDFLKKCDEAIRRLENQRQYTPPPPKQQATYTSTTRPRAKSPASSYSDSSYSSKSIYEPIPKASAPSDSGRSSSAAREASRVMHDFISSIPASFGPVLGISFVLWLIVGTGACLNRFANVPFKPEDAGYGNERLWKYIFGAYLYEALFAVGIVFGLWVLVTFLRFLFAVQRSSSIRSGGKALTAGTVVAVVVGVTAITLGAVWGVPRISALLSSATSPESSGTSSSGDTPSASKTIKADKVTKGRTADEKVHEFIVPANQWVETGLKITTNHHFTSNESVKVNLGGTTDTRLQKAGTILPLYTSANCSKDAGVKAKVKYTCIQLTQSEAIKLYAANSVRVGVVVKNR